MTVSTITSRELNQDLGRAKKAALEGPVVITDRGKPAHVLLSYSDYAALLGERPNIIDALAMPGLSACDLNLPRLTFGLQPADLS